MKSRGNHRDRWHYLGIGESDVTGNRPGDEAALMDGPDHGGKRNAFDEPFLLLALGVCSTALPRPLGSTGGVDVDVVVVSIVAMAVVVVIVDGACSRGLFGGGFFNLRGELRDHKRILLAAAAEAALALRLDKGVSEKDRGGDWIGIEEIRSKSLIRGVGHDGDLKN